MIYLDNSATSRYIPPTVMKAFENECKRKSNSGRSGHNDSIASALKIQKVREIICDFFKMKDGETIFTKNCTEALNLAIIGSYSGGHIVTTVTEHNSVLRPLTYLQKTKRADVSFARPDKNGGVGLERIKCALKQDTRLVIINACSNVTGTPNDYEEICKYCAENGIRTILDASQMAGHRRIEVDKIGCDMLCCSGHKGLYGLQGTGFLTFNERVKIAPLLFGGTGTESIKTEQPTIYPESLESGTLNSAGIIALGEAVKWVDERIEKLSDDNVRNTETLISELKKNSRFKIFSTPNQSGIVAFIVPGQDSETIADYLNECDIAVRGGLHCAPLMHKYLGTVNSGLVRVSFGHNNTRKDTEKLVTALNRFIKTH